MNKKSALFNRKELISLLEELNVRLAAKNIRGEICLYGGSALILGWNSREMTRDIDATFVPASEIRKIAANMAEDKALPDNWLNDGVKGFLSSRGRPSAGRKPYLELSNLSVYIPEPSYLLAMKAMAARTTEEQSDREDIEFLLRKMNINRPEEVMTVILDYYPKKSIQPKTFYFIEAILEEMNT